MGSGLLGALCRRCGRSLGRGARARRSDRDPGFSRDRTDRSRVYGGLHQRRVAGAGRQGGDRPHLRVGLGVGLLGRACEPLFGIALEVGEDAACHVPGWVRKLHQEIVDGSGRLDVCSERPAPPAESRGFQRIDERPRLMPRQSRYGLSSIGMADRRATPEPGSCHADRFDFLDRDRSGPERKRQRQDIRVHGGGLGVSRTQKCQQERGRTGSAALKRERGLQDAFGGCAHPAKVLADRKKMKSGPG